MLNDKAVDRPLIKPMSSGVPMPKVKQPKGDGPLYLAAKIRTILNDDDDMFRALLTLKYVANQVLGVGGCGAFDKKEHDDYEEIVSKYKINGGK